MKIGIIGSGNVAKCLAKGFVTEGDEVFLGTRDPTKLAELAGPKCHVGTLTQAAQFGEVLVLATHWGPLGADTKNAIDVAGPAHFVGKPVIDCTNPLTPMYTLEPTAAVTTSGGEIIQGWLPGAHVVKAFNTVAAPFMYKPRGAAITPDMMFAGNDPAAKAIVATIITKLGHNPRDFGDLTGARNLEMITAGWLRWAFGLKHGLPWSFALIESKESALMPSGGAPHPSH